MKRFTESQKWEDPWFRKLSPQMKLLWQWILDKCDNAGVIEPDMDLATFQIGYPYSIDSLSELGDRIVTLSCGKWFIPKFITFQYGTLSEECRAHNPVYASLAKHNINATNLQEIGYPKGMDSLYIKDKDKDKYKDKEEESENIKPKARGSVQEFKEYASQLGLPESDGEFLHDHFLEGGWKRGNQPIKDWKATLRKWKSCKWLPSQKNQQPNRHHNSYNENPEIPDA